MIFGQPIIIQSLGSLAQRTNGFENLCRSLIIIYDFVGGLEIFFCACTFSSKLALKISVFNFFFVGDINDLNDEVSQSSKKMTSTLTPSSSMGADPQSPLSSVDNVFPTSQSTGAIGEEPGSGDCMYMYHIVHF